VRTASFGLAIGYAALLFMSTVVLGLVVYWRAQTSLHQQQTARIDSEVNLLIQEFRTEGLGQLVNEINERTECCPTLDYLVIGADGKKLTGTLPRSPVSEGWAEVTSLPTKAGVKTFRTRTTNLDGNILSVGEDLAPLKEMQAAFAEALLWALVAFLFLSVSGGLVLSRAFLQRVDAITQTADAIIGGKLQSRIPLRGTDDNFDRLSKTLNLMLDRIQVLMESLSQVSNDIAHELRTPLGRLQQKLEAALESAKGNTECATAIDEATTEIGNILETFSALLRIAQVEAGTRNAGFGPVDLSNLFETVGEAYAAAAEDQGKVLVTSIAPSIKSQGDKSLLTEMLANLVDNAIRHTPKGTNIEVTLVNGGPRLVATVADDGPGVPDAERDRIFRRFYRLERSIGTPGHGLGLSLVAAVAELHGVELRASDNYPGLRITMTFNPLIIDQQVVPASMI
jgi:signal transduction histidine kinase